MKRFLLSATVASMIMGSAGLAMAQSAGSEKDGAPGPDRGAAATMPSATEVNTLLTSKGYTNVSAVQTGNANGKVKAHAMKNGAPVNLEIDMNTGSVIEVK
ncbi:MAG TPA: hypothetical protein VFS04_09165 [Alphaproteobacteria bacterium]|nr:hypothetical protein [Alphaproteobacteria bacterium]